ncbi:hypothetical protein F6A13_10850 [Acidithiobacillus sp. 'AMD consortium']|uniref:Secreted protein n=1 Tax=Acidithiobacillus ferrooxidans (strain ATCC 23270 / DSM 14882 / CIP 104768 / NCIMB 8455) TaxID=243159 RepID=B7J6X5_ACIF2|nr:MULTISPECIES: hypothetical protein [Acidithiobacillus]ACK80645.1 hypothetical protein AFE_2435 [Acidithiobacillus ferrooxidans ATCC 23270]MBN6746101.1 hypothetical protein [Acidithiobacillus sp. MC2.2]MBN6749104.1 hypothetical protein [Acidithiobacillus sp. PG05]MBU2773490.1 hypothetical protein [Acidithiobacillus ferrooxidans]MBU2825371.1 hypothetical protein [Acidithiobacillus ferrooxidans]
MALLLLLPWMLAPVDAASAPCALSMTGVAAHSTQTPRCEQTLGAPAQQGTCLTACCHHDMMTPVAESANNITPAMSALAVSVASWLTLPSPKPVPHFLHVAAHTGLPPLSAVRFLI